jgi:hypothetical protein
VGVKSLVCPQTFEQRNKEKKRKGQQDKSLNRHASKFIDKNCSIHLSHPYYKEKQPNSHTPTTTHILRHGMISKRTTKIFWILFLLEAEFSLSGCETTNWTHPDPSKNLKHDLTECNYNTMKNVCSNSAATVTTHCSSSNSVTTCKPAVIPASNVCHDELQLGPRDDCLKEMGWVKRSP